MHLVQWQTTSIGGKQQNVQYNEDAHELNKPFVKGPLSMGMIELNVKLIMQQSKAHDYAGNR